MVRSKTLSGLARQMAIWGQSYLEDAGRKLPQETKRAGRRKELAAAGRRRKTCLQLHVVTLHKGLRGGPQISVELRQAVVQARLKAGGEGRGIRLRGRVREACLACQLGQLAMVPLVNASRTG